MNGWVSEVRENNYNIQYLRDECNFVADQLSRPVLVIVRPPETTSLGLSRDQFSEKQNGEAVWRKVMECLEGGRLQLKGIPRATLNQFVLQGSILYFVREKSDGNLHHRLGVPRTLITLAIEHSHEMCGHLGQKKTIQKAEALFYYANLKGDVCQYVKACIFCQRFKGDTGLQQQ